jgi:hypothetical protein
LAFASKSDVSGDTDIPEIHEGEVIQTASLKGVTWDIWIQMKLFSDSRISEYGEINVRPTVRMELVASFDLDQVIFKDK